MWICVGTLNDQRWRTTYVTSLSDPVEAKGTGPSLTEKHKVLCFFRFYFAGVPLAQPRLFSCKVSCCFSLTVLGLTSWTRWSEGV